MQCATILTNVVDDQKQTIFFKQNSNVNLANPIT